MGIRVKQRRNTPFRLFHGQAVGFDQPCYCPRRAPGFLVDLVVFLTWIWISTKHLQHIDYKVS